MHPITSEIDNESHRLIQYPSALLHQTLQRNALVKTTADHGRIAPYLWLLAVFLPGCLLPDCVNFIRSRNSAKWMLMSSWLAKSFATQTTWGSSSWKIYSKSLPIFVSHLTLQIETSWHLHCRKCMYQSYGKTTEELLHPFNYLSSNYHLFVWVEYCYRQECSGLKRLTFGSKTPKAGDNGVLFV